MVYMGTVMLLFFSLIDPTQLKKAFPPSYTTCSSFWLYTTQTQVSKHNIWLLYCIVTRESLFVGPATASFKDLVRADVIVIPCHTVHTHALLYGCLRSLTVLFEDASISKSANRSALASKEIQLLKGQLVIASSTNLSVCQPFTHGLFFFHNQETRLVVGMQWKIWSLLVLKLL